MAKVNYHIAVFWVALTLASCAIALAIDDDEAWREFTTTYGKSYASKEEEELRKKVFIDNKNFIESHNVKNTQKSFTQGLNHLSDMTQEEINRSRNGFRLNTSEIHYRPIDGLLEHLLVALNSSYQPDQLELNDRGWLDNIFAPPKLDYRTQGRVSKVKDQGSCGSCWSFATTGALESILTSRNKNVLLSEQNLIDCSRRYGNYGCNGGMMDAALRYVRDNGIMASKDYEYTGKDQNCKFVRQKSVTRVRGSAILPRGNEGLLRLALYLTGPIPIAIDASARAFHSYKSGVYDDRSCHSSSNALNHAVLLVGYGSESNGREYWIVKNSWGTKWGDNGYIKMARNKHNLCGIATYAVLPIP